MLKKLLYIWLILSIGIFPSIGFADSINDINMDQEIYGDAYKEGIYSGRKVRVDLSGGKTQEELSKLDTAEAGSNSNLIDENGNPIVNVPVLSDKTEDEMLLSDVNNYMAGEGTKPIEKVELDQAFDKCKARYEAIKNHPNNASIKERMPDANTFCTADVQKAIALCARGQAFDNETKTFYTPTEEHYKMCAENYIKDNGDFIDLANANEKVKPSSLDGAILDAALCGLGVPSFLLFDNKVCREDGNFSILTDYVKENPGETALFVASFLLPFGLGFVAKAAIKGGTRWLKLLNVADKGLDGVAFIPKTVTNLGKSVLKGITNETKVAPKELSAVEKWENYTNNKSFFNKLSPMGNKKMSVDASNELKATNNALKEELTQINQQKEIAFIKKEQENLSKFDKQYKELSNINKQYNAEKLKGSNMDFSKMSKLKTEKKNILEKINKGETAATRNARKDVAKEFDSKSENIVQKIKDNNEKIEKIESGVKVNVKDSLISGAVSAGGSSGAFATAKNLYYDNTTPLNPKIDTISGAETDLSQPLGQDAKEYQSQLAEQVRINHNNKFK